MSGRHQIKIKQEQYGKAASTASNAKSQELPGTPAGHAGALHTGGLAYCFSPSSRSLRGQTQFWLLVRAPDLGMLYDS